MIQNQLHPPVLTKQLDTKETSVFCGNIGLASAFLVESFDYKCNFDHFGHGRRWLGRSFKNPNPSGDSGVFISFKRSFAFERGDHTGLLVF